MKRARSPDHGHAMQRHTPICIRSIIGRLDCFCGSKLRAVHLVVSPPYTVNSSPDDSGDTDVKKLTDLRGILQYIPQFREKTFILAIDGAIVTDDNFATLLLDVALLWSLNIRVVLVHGAVGTDRGARRGAARRARRTSMAPASPMPPRSTLALTAANRLTHEILEGLSANDLRAAART